LKHPRFRDNARLQSAYDNEPALHWGERGDAILQQALIDLGYPMPISTKNGTEPPDGDFRSETWKTVYDFLTDNSLQTD